MIDAETLNGLLDRTYRMAIDPDLADWLRDLAAALGAKPEPDIPVGWTASEVEEWANFYAGIQRPFGTPQPWPIRGPDE